MNIKRIEVGMLNTNCYILENNNECLIVDPGDDFESIKDKVSKKLVGVLLTHRHFDHVGALEDVVNYYNCNVYDKSNLKEGNNKIGKFEFIVKYNPGHTLDSISFVFNDNMFGGDFIFLDTIGRWDLGGDFSLMKESIRNLLKSDINYKIFPGHGDSTSLNKEKEMLESYIK